MDAERRSPHQRGHRVGGKPVAVTSAIARPGAEGYALTELDPPFQQPDRAPTSAMARRVGCSHRHSSAETSARSAWARRGPDRPLSRAQLCALTASASLASSHGHDARSPYKRSLSRTSQGGAPPPCNARATSGSMPGVHAVTQGSSRVSDLCPSRPSLHRRSSIDLWSCLSRGARSADLGASFPRPGPSLREPAIRRAGRVDRPGCEAERSLRVLHPGFRTRHNPGSSEP